MLTRSEMREIGSVLIFLSAAIMSFSRIGASVFLRGASSPISTTEARCSRHLFNTGRKAGRTCRQAAQARSRYRGLFGKKFSRENILNCIRFALRPQCDSPTLQTVVTGVSLTAMRCSTLIFYSLLPLYRRVAPSRSDLPILSTLYHPRLTRCSPTGRRRLFGVRP